MSYDIARETFGKGKSPYFITGPWQIPEQTEALGDDLMVCPIPNWEGSDNTAKPFLGVRTFFQTAKAKNPTLASTFLNDTVMTTEFMDGMYSVDPRPPAWLESFEKASSDPVIKAFGDYGATGEPMPNIQQMGNVFGDAGLAEYKVSSGEDRRPRWRRRRTRSTRRTPTSAEQGGPAAHVLVEHGGGGAGGRQRASRSPKTTALIVKIILVGLIDALLILCFAKTVQAEWWLAAAFFAWCSSPSTSRTSPTGRCP